MIYVTAQLCLSTGYLVLPLEALNRALVSGAAVFNVIETVSSEYTVYWVISGRQKLCILNLHRFLF